MFLRIWALAVFVAIISASAARASEYPGDYALHSSCAINGPVRICRDLQAEGAVALNVYYSGYLTQYMTSISVFVKINYQNGSRAATFPMYYYGPGTVYSRVTNGCLVGEIGGCAAGGTPPMHYLLYWAAHDMTLNGLNVEVAFVDAMGRWDSQYSQNYGFYFPEYDGD